MLGTLTFRAARATINAWYRVFFCVERQSDRMEQNETRPIEEQLTGMLRFCGKTLHHGMGGKCSQDRILLLLHRHGTVTQRELMDITGLQSGSMSEVVGKIEENGFLRREKNEADKRNVDVTLTEAGWLEAERVRKRRQELESMLFAPLSAAEQEQLLALLTKLTAAWKQNPQIHTGRRPQDCERERGENGNG